MKKITATIASALAAATFALAIPATAVATTHSDSGASAKPTRSAGSPARSTSAAEAPARTAGVATPPAAAALSKIGALNAKLAELNLPK